jgi:hypothetical protein
MTVRVDNVQSDVHVEGTRRDGARQREAPTWQETERLREARARLERDSARTCATGYDD